MKIKVEVTEKDIELGKKSVTSCTKCAVARALERVYSGSINVGVDICYLDHQGIKLPRTAATFIKRLCHDKPVKPFSFTISLPA